MRQLSNKFWRKRQLLSTFCVPEMRTHMWGSGRCTELRLRSYHRGPVAKTRRARKRLPQGVPAPKALQENCSAGEPRRLDVSEARHKNITLKTELVSQCKRDWNGTFSLHFANTYKRRTGKSSQTVENILQGCEVLHNFQHVYPKNMPLYKLFLN